MPLRIGLFNIQGLTTERTNKIKSPEFINIYKTHDILLLTETWTSDLSDVSIDGFEHVILNRTEKKAGTKCNSGGLIIYIRSELYDENTFVKNEGDDIIWIKLRDKIASDKPFYICLCYVLPSGTTRNSMVDYCVFDRLLDTIVDIESKQADCSFVICGDMNARTREDPDYVVDDNIQHVPLPEEYILDDEIPPRVSCDKTGYNSNGQQLLDFCKQTSLRIVNGRYGADKMVGNFTCTTSRGQSVVDYVLASKHVLNEIVSFEVGEPNILSDHSLVSFSLATYKDFTIQNDLSEPEQVHADYKYNWDGQKVDDFIERLSSQSTIHIFDNMKYKLDESIIQSDSIDESLQLFVSTLENCAKPLFLKKLYTAKASDSPEIEYSKSNAPWFDDECYSKRVVFYRYLNLFRGYKSDENRINMVNARSNYKMSLRKARLRYDIAETNRLNKLRYKNARDYWKLLKSASQTCKTNIPLSTFERYFRAINTPDSDFYVPDEDIIFSNERYIRGEYEEMFDELNVAFTNDEILKAIKQLKYNKSAGPDKLLNEFFIHGAHILLPYIVSLFNSIFNHGYFPKEWSMGEIIPLHKKGSLNNVDNYRGITLLSVFGKLFTRILNNRLTQWAENYSIYVEAQGGFREAMGTTDHIFALHGIISHLLNNNKKLFCAFVDFSKAFDYVVRENLWFKLIKLGVRGKILNIIMSMYNNVKSRVKFNTAKGKEFVCHTGVRQGECLSPFLFSMFINDLENELSTKGAEGFDMTYMKIFLLLYADDIVLFSETSTGLQDGLDILFDYCSKWKLTVNTLKTKVMIFRKGGMISRNTRFYYGDFEVNIVNKFTYLGIVFTPGGAFAEAQAALSGQALKAIFVLNKYVRKFVNLKPKHMLDLFDKLVKPILNYSAEVWGFSQSMVTERIHLQFCKKLLGVKQCTQNDFIYGELGRTTLLVDRHFQIIKYWLKICRTNDNKYIKHIYNLLMSDIHLRPNKANWVSLIRDLLSNLGFYYAWENQSVGNEKVFLSLIRQRLTDNFIQNWNSRINDSSRALCYKNLSSFSFKPYLEIVTIKKFRIALSRLRTSAHRLEVESGRWARPVKKPIDQRLCTFCGVLEDEFHFVLQCPVYNTERHKHIDKRFYKRPNMLKFIELMTSDSKRIVENLACFVQKSFVLRNALFYN